MMRMGRRRWEVQVKVEVCVWGGGVNEELTILFTRVFGLFCFLKSCQKILQDYTTQMVLVRVMYRE